MCIRDSGYSILFNFFSLIHFGLITLIIMLIGKSLPTPIMHSWFILVWLVLYYLLYFTFVLCIMVCVFYCLFISLSFYIYLIANTIFSLGLYFPWLMVHLIIFTLLSLLIHVFISFHLSLGQSLGLGHSHLSRIRYSHSSAIYLKLLILL